MAHGPWSSVRIKSILGCFRCGSGVIVFSRSSDFNELYLADRKLRRRWCWLKGEFVGYQAAVKTGKHFSGLHGAFDRQRATTYHAYSILFVKMVEFAVEHELKMIDFGVVLNETKKRMVNKTNQLSYFLLSKSALFKWILVRMHHFTRMQGQEQVQYLNVDK